MSKEQAAGAAQSLNKTITEIMEYLRDEKDRPNRKLRKFLREKIADSNLLWYGKGFNRGHRESFRIFHEDGQVPRTIQYECERELFTDLKREIILESTIEKAAPVKPKIKKPRK